MPNVWPDSSVVIVHMHFERVRVGSWGGGVKFYMRRLEDLTVLKRSPDLLNNVKIGQDQQQLIIKNILFYGGCGHFGQVT